MSLWIELYPLISADIRFSAMLGQIGSTPLDLFKFYVENLKARFHDEKKIIKEILKEADFVIKASTTFEEFATVVCEDKRSASLDAGNVKLTYNSMLEKAEAIHKEKMKEESKRLRKLMNELKQIWLDANISSEHEWGTAKELVVGTDAYEAYSKDGSVEQLFEEYIRESEDTCTHHHSRSRKSKKNKKHKKRPHSISKSVREQYYQPSIQLQCLFKLNFHFQGSELSEVEYEKAKKSKRSRSVIELNILRPLYH